MSPPSQITALGPLVSPHPILPPRRDRQQHPRQHDNPKPTPSTRLYHSSSHKHRKAAATRVTLRSSSRGRRTKRRSGRGGRLRAESSRASGSGGIGRRSRAGGDGVEVEANVLIDHTVMLTTPFFSPDLWWLPLAMPDAMVSTRSFNRVAYHCICLASRA
jgi:hypothetical protein